MPKKKKGRRNNDNKEQQSRPLIYAEYDQVYGKALRLLGDARCDVYCFDGKTRMCKIRGKMRKREWIRVGDIVLVSKREFQDEKGDIIHLYTKPETRNLQLYDEIPKDTNIGCLTSSTPNNDNVDCAFVFENI